jgi:dTDP-4-dehydrorhamnose reductase
LIKILVTGSNGQLGSELRVASLSHSKEYDWIFVERGEFDLSDLSSLESRLNFFDADVIINCAAYTAVDKAESERELADKINNKAVGIISRWTKNNSAKLIHISTDYVFDGLSNTPLTEEAIVSPINVYGRSKLAGEIVCFKENSNSIIIRTSWVYSSFGTNFVKTMLRLMFQREQLKIVNDQIGSPTYAADLANIILLIVGHDVWNPGTYHFSNEGEITWFKFAQDIKKISGLECELVAVNSSEFPTIAQRPAFSLLDKSKIKQTFNIGVPDYYESLNSCLRQIIDQSL